MYIKITTRCNMKCAHCCMNATRKGEDMTLETFKDAIDACDCECITIGGGEPTLHPDFERFLFYALAHVENVYMVTNGSQTERALVLAGLAKRGVLGVALSRDQWHDEIDPRVVEAFTHNRKNRDYYGTADNHDQREIRDVGNNPRGIIRVGRAARKSFRDNYETYEDCACNGDAVVDPNGDVRQCGCAKSPIVGNVRDGYTSMVEHLEDTNCDIWCCYREAEKVLREQAKMLDKPAVAC